jgi:hypothetical protein
MFIAQKKVNQGKVNKAVKFLTKHNELNNQRDQVEGEHGEESRLWVIVDRQCARAFDKYEEACDELPKYEVRAIEKSELY